MIALLQRVQHAKVEVSGRCVGEIPAGLLAFIGIEPNDSEKQADRLLQRLLSYRMFDDQQGRMNRSLTDTAGGLLLVSQFTLAADTTKGTRPGFSTAASPSIAEPLFNYLVNNARKQHPGVASGEFAANMQVSLCNDGPVTFWLEVR